MERETCSHFVASTGKKENSPGVFKHYLRCHRSGIYAEVPTEKRQRQKKQHSSCKIDKHCFATLDVTEKGNKVFAEFQRQHYGHLMEVSHQRLSVAETTVLAGKLGQGVPPKIILQKIQASSSTNSDRMNLVTREDLWNISEKFKITKQEQRHPDDFISVDMWIAEMTENNGAEDANNDLVDLDEANQKDRRCPLLYYKKVGDPRENDGNFELALMTFPQMQLLRKLRTQKLCIDSTHGTNIYNSQLTTLLTIAEDGSGIPCAYLISKRVNTETMATFFETIQKKGGVMQYQAFMSDDAPVYGNAWEQVMGPLPKRLPCAWDMLCDWNAHINSITNK